MSEENPKELFEKLQPVLEQGPEIPSDAIYTPPLHDAIDDTGIYLPDDPSTERDRLINTERKFLFPIAWAIAKVFRTPPITDDIFRSVPEEHKDSRLFLLVSRTGIKSVKSGIIEWDAIRVIVRRYDIIRVSCRMDFSTGKFEIRKVWLWTNYQNDWVPVEDPAGSAIDIPTLVEVLAQYALSEGVIR